ncbi:tetratricopeptide repeat protein [Treponema sp. Marseille-Q4132]|uniref:tetratricopeptide repeat protein n=1 Tax=Treponema sp. Marseille-Q4132 TaxID=2766701 RepID=UPI001652BE8D|nr:tetratricopeptide repeat protein [Treponema sp. Marseille-Q4132]QNL97164.1 tetratricopeptide repeat protein [Treponema sp. Marseille-Q4132]
MTNNMTDERNADKNRFFRFHISTQSVIDPAVQKKRKAVFCALCVLLLAIPLFASPSTAAEFYSRGVERQNGEEWYEATELFLEAVRINPAYADAWFRLAECAYQLGQYDTSLGYLSSAEKYARNSTAVQNLRGMCRIALGNLSEARLIFEKILAQYPNDVNARFGMAELDLFSGRISAAEGKYAEALERDPSNRKALLSLAFVSAERDNAAAASRYMSQALRYHSGEAEVHYMNAKLAAMQGNLSAAERAARTAVEINGRYDKAYELLASILYSEKKYADAIDVSDFRIARSRNAGGAWYLKGLSQYREGNTAAAIATWTTGLSVDPFDEVMRAALELEVNKTVPIEDARRKEWSKWHIKNAGECMKRFDGTGASYEYQRALKVNPTDTAARRAFAEMLDINGLHELCLEQLKFVQDNRDPLSSVSSEARRTSERRLDDTVEAYDSLLQDSLAKRWNVEPFYLDKIRWRIGLYYAQNTARFVHADSPMITARFAADMFSGVSVTFVRARTAPVSGFGEAYRKAQSAGEDYFIMLSLDEGERDIVLDATMYSGRTGSAVRSMSFYGTGSGRYTNVLRRFRSAVLSNLPVRGKILDRSGTNLLIDIGRSELLQKGAVFAVVPKGALKTADSNIGLTYADRDALGTLTITEAGEEVSEGEFVKSGFYDRVNTGDEVVLVSMPDKAAESKAGNASRVVDNAPAARAGAVSEKPKAISANDLGERRNPALVDIIRSIY